MPFIRVPYSRSEERSISGTNNKNVNVNLNGYPDRETNINCITEVIKECVRYAKGQFLASGASGILELSPCGDVMKSPWPGQHGEDSRRDITIENEI